MPTANFEVEERRVIGLRLPDGTEIWPDNSWHGRGVETPEDRRVIVESLKVSARNLSVEESLLLEAYRWIVRVDKVYNVVVVGDYDFHTLESPLLLEDPEVVNTEDDSPDEMIADIVED